MAVVEGFRDSVGVTWGFSRLCRGNLGVLGMRIKKVI